MEQKRKEEGLRIVVVGHVDHGKSTVIGRLLYDTESLPEGAVDKVRRIAKETGKPFEYAYLLDAFEEEQKQGITIDTTQIQFATAKREYVIIDAPGHKEFLKNMISGAANANAAMLIVDAQQGAQEAFRPELDGAGDGHERLGQGRGGRVDLEGGQQAADHGEFAAGDGVHAEDGQAVAGFDLGGDALEDGGFADAVGAGEDAGEAAALGEKGEAGDGLLMLVAGEEQAPVDDVQEGVALQIPVRGVHGFRS